MEKSDALNLNNNPLLKIENIDLTYDSNKDIKVLDDFSLDVYSGEILGLVGESGCGKTTLGRSIIGLEKIDYGKIIFEGKEVDYKSGKNLRDIRRNIQMIFQDPYLSLDPTMNVEKTIKEPLLYLRENMTNKQKSIRVKEVMSLIEMDIKLIHRKSKELSGGQRQRVGIGRALAISPQIIICDEPVSALDVSVQASILNLLKKLQRELNITMIFISHDLSVVNYLANRICVMLKGKVCEIGNKDSIFTSCKHPYTKYLLDSIPKINFKEETYEGVEEEIEYLDNGCPFYTRCKFATKICAREFPEKTEENGHIWYCHNYNNFDLNPPTQD
ncbi:oligopeptide/dipeptide ABC transporter ATP-binding protein [Lagierella sp.]|uniref:ABC transporter ATP-binding protein n=1 Tax=Lagierella sp. TaxID=2849657 RepID=UPI00262CC7C4|nr:oligopeptide/dipeptide ABC transporter ATP-binding protein [Lagierella sp.]